MAAPTDASAAMRRTEASRRASSVATRSVDTNGWGLARIQRLPRTDAVGSAVTRMQATITQPRGGAWSPRLHVSHVRGGYATIWVATSATTVPAAQIPGAHRSGAGTYERGSRGRRDAVRRPLPAGRFIASSVTSTATIAGSDDEGHEEREVDLPEPECGEEHRRDDHAVHEEKHPEPAPQRELVADQAPSFEPGIDAVIRAKRSTSWLVAGRSEGSVHTTTTTRRKRLGTTSIMTLYVSTY